MYIRKRVNVNACFYCLCFGEMFVSTKSKLVYDPTLQTITYKWKYFIEFLDHSFIITQTFCGKNIAYTNYLIFLYSWNMVHDTKRYFNLWNCKFDFTNVPKDNRKHRSRNNFCCYNKFIDFWPDKYIIATTNNLMVAFFVNGSVRFSVVQS